VAVGVGWVPLEPLPEPPQAVTVTVQVVVTAAHDEVVAGAELEEVTAQRASRSLARAAPTRAEVMAKKRILIDVLN